MRKIAFNRDPRLNASFTEDYIDHLDEVSDERDISRAALCRKWIAAGERAEAAVIPDFDDPGSSESTVQDPIEQLFRRELPDTADEAISLDEMRERLKEKIDGKVVNLYRELDDIEVTDGGDMYADE